MRLRGRLGQLEDAVADLRQAYDRLIGNVGFPVANLALYDGISDLNLATEKPLVSLELLSGAVKAALTDSQPTNRSETETQWLRSKVLYQTLKSLYMNQQKGAASLVLDVTPLCTVGQLQMAARRAMSATADAADEKLLLDAMHTGDATVRDVCAGGLTSLLRERPAGELSKMVAGDDDQVRLAAAINLANLGDRAALDALGDLLESSELSVRSRSVQALRALSGKQFEFSPHDPAEDRRLAAKKWQQWIRNEGTHTDLNLPIDEKDLMAGRTLLTCYVSGRVLEIDPQGEETWQAQLPGAWGCHGLPNGHRLVCSCSSPTVIEFDAWGDVVWHATVGGNPFSVQRLANGNTLVACQNGRVQEIKPDKTVAWEVTLPQCPVDAHRLDNGNTLVCLKTANRVVEIDRSGRIVWDLSGMTNLRSAQRLPNGNTLVCHSGLSRVIEVDPHGVIVWSKSGLSDPMDAQRLGNGHTLVADSAGLREIDLKGHEVWERSLAGVTRFSRFTPDTQEPHDNRSHESSP
jgi:hypothetical protein